MHARGGRPGIRSPGRELGRIGPGRGPSCAGSCRRRHLHSAPAGRAGRGLRYTACACGVRRGLRRQPVPHGRRWHQHRGGAPRRRRRVHRGPARDDHHGLRHPGPQDRRRVMRDQPCPHGGGVVRHGAATGGQGCGVRDRRPRDRGGRLLRHPCAREADGRVGGWRRGGAPDDRCRMRADAGARAARRCVRNDARAGTQSRDPGA
mmetsp:Transcript_41872/g.99327  ORF Transcript_41872/g.99327 Transcript_41872/m.99327 type:complete len:205 (+) Transcript_41872:1749-2363(+)